MPQSEQDIDRLCGKILESLPLIAFTYNTEGKGNYFNGRWYEYTGIQPSHGHDIFSFMHPGDIPAAMQKWSVNLQAGNAFEGTFRFKKSDGSYFWHLARIIPVRNEKNEIISWTGTLTNIDAEKNFSEQLELKVRERTEELLHTVAQLDQFAHAASHDLQEPLRKIVTFSSRLQNFSNHLPQEALSYIHKIGKASTRMARLIKDLLEYSRLVSHEKLFQPTDLNEVVNNLIAGFETALEQKNGRIEIGDLPELEAIPLQMNQLFYNLISNALKFSKEDVPPLITITSRQPAQEVIRDLPELDPGLEYFEIIIKDNGIGFDIKYAKQIFIIFQRLNDRAQYEGTGIGLAVCKKIAENHLGAIYAEGEENAGATFHVFLPVEHPRK